MRTLTKWDIVHKSISGHQFLFNFTTAVRDIVIDYLKVLFKYSPLASQYRYDEDEKLTKVFIGSVFPLEERFFPRIIVQVTVSQDSIISFGDIGRDEKDNFVLTGRFEYAGSLLISATEDKITMDLADISLLFIANRFFRSQLLKYGVGIIDSAGFRATDIRRTNLTPYIPIFEVTINFSLFSEWQQLIEKKGIVVSGEIVEIEI